jgi:hypothetical protein
VVVISNPSNGYKIIRCYQLLLGMIRYYFGTGRRIFKSVCSTSKITNSTSKKCCGVKMAKECSFPTKPI